MTQPTLLEAPRERPSEARRRHWRERWAYAHAVVDAAWEKAERDNFVRPGQQGRGESLHAAESLTHTNMAKANIAVIEPGANGNELVIRLPVQTPALSKSGKSQVIATTSGNVTTEVQVNGKSLIVGVNAFIPI